MCNACNANLQGGPFNNSDYVNGIMLFNMLLIKSIQIQEKYVRIRSFHLTCSDVDEIDRYVDSVVAIAK